MCHNHQQLASKSHCHSVSVLEHEHANERTHQAPKTVRKRVKIASLSQRKSESSLHQTRGDHHRAYNGSVHKHARHAGKPVRGLKCFQVSPPKLLVKIRRLLKSGQPHRPFTCITGSSREWRFFLLIMLYQKLSVVLLCLIV